MAVKGSKIKLEKSLSPMQITRAKNEATKFTQKLERSVVQYPAVPQKRPGKSKSLTSKAKVMMPEKVRIAVKQNTKTGKVSGRLTVGYHSRPSHSGTNGTIRKSAGSIPKIEPKSGKKIDQQNASLKNELIQKAVRSAGVITGGQIKPKYKKMSSGIIEAQSGLVEGRKKGKRRK